ncbi:MAG: M14-type cytosolic carboxypeptidase [Motiliproteus sp.]
MISISSEFDGGNIEVVDISKDADIRLKIRPDKHSEFYQWFYFRLQGAAGQHCRIRLLNAFGAAYVDGWQDYNIVASYDRRNWFRLASAYQHGELQLDHQPVHDSIYYAYFVPYSYEQHQDLVSQAQLSSRCRLESLGRTLDGRDIDLLTVSAGPVVDNRKKLSIWISARQHSGETMAEWFMQGLIERLLDETDPLVQGLLDKADFYLLPNLNPDGSIRGHLRTNAIGVNLNREWHAPSMSRSPEVFQTLAKMDASGVDLYLDIHGDETIPYNFLAGCAGNPDFSERLAKLESSFEQGLLDATDEFQTQQGYTPDQFGEETLMLASNQVGHRFDCLSMTLEMPFKDNILKPDAAQGWSPQRSMQLGKDMLQPIHKVLTQLR